MLLCGYVDWYSGDLKKINSYDLDCAFRLMFTVFYSMWDFEREKLLIYSEIEIWIAKRIPKNFIATNDLRWIPKNSKEIPNI